ncbi:MAG TPA: hypothetical protein VJG32_01265 [Anaerolineae bacterium]|nr:hypothetical protein [Anaerolineae bacterium]
MEVEPLEMSAALALDVHVAARQHGDFDNVAASRRQEWVEEAQADRARHDFVDHASQHRRAGRACPERSRRAALSGGIGQQRQDTLANRPAHLAAAQLGQSEFACHPLGDFGHEELAVRRLNRGGCSV